MKKLISAKTAGNILIVLLVLLAVFHLLILLSVLPYSFVWGGQLQDAGSMFMMESISLIVTILFLSIVLMKTGYIKAIIPKIVITICMWIICVFFFISVIQNLALGVSLEKMIFIPVSFIMALFALRLAIEK